ncbi:MAG: hypothetical protein IV100_32385 [Myxococcales bacterium]|nr:hypothetical protein [Myxococcales bacterium]
MACRACRDLAPFYYYKYVRIYSVSGTRGYFRIQGAGTTLYSADWTNLNDLCPAVSMPLVANTTGDVALGENWLIANRVPYAGDDKHPITLAAAFPYKRKTVTVDKEWIQVELPAAGGMTCWIPENALWQRGEISSRFGRVYEGLRADPATATAVRASIRTGARPDTVSAPALTDAQWEALNEGTIIILGQFYELDVKLTGGAGTKRVYIDPTDRQKASNRAALDLDEPDTQFLYIHDRFIQNEGLT